MRGGRSFRKKQDEEEEDKETTAEVKDYRAEGDSQTKHTIMSSTETRRARSVDLHTWSSLLYQQIL